MEEGTSPSIFCIRHCPPLSTLRYAFKLKRAVDQSISEKTSFEFAQAKGTPILAVVKIAKRQKSLLFINSPLFALNTILSLFTPIAMAKRITTNLVKAIHVADKLILKKLKKPVRSKKSLTLPPKNPRGASLSLSNFLNEPLQQF